MQVSTLNSTVGHLESECKRLAEKNESLSEQLTSSIERPRAEGSEQQQKGHNGQIENGHQAVADNEKLEIEKKYQHVLQEKENL